MAVGITTFETLPTQSLKGYPGNARKHSRRQIKQLTESIREFGFVSAILIDEDNTIVAGHGRWEAAAAMGCEALPVIRVTGLTETQKKALRIADNRLGERSQWDLGRLKTELEAIVECSYDTDLTGYSRIEVDALLTVDGVDGADEAPAPAPRPKVVTRPGDLWRMRRHHVLCADAREAASYERVLCGELAHQVIADLPFNLAIAGTVSGLGAVKHGEFAMASGEMSSAEFVEFIRIAMTRARDASENGSIHYWFCDWRIVADMTSVGKSVYTELKNIAVWVKTNSGMGAFLRSQHELVVILKNGRAPHTNNVQLGRLGRNRSNVWVAEGANTFGSLRDKALDDHPTPKSIRLIADAMRDTSRPNDLILDPFGGSGTTLIAAEDIGRRAAIIELEPKFVDVMLRRFIAHTGEEPVLLPHATPFSVVLRQRLGVDHG